MQKTLIKFLITSFLSFLFLVGWAFFTQAKEGYYGTLCGEEFEKQKPPCSGTVIKVDVADMESKPEKGCPDGKKFGGCISLNSDCVANGLNQLCTAVNVCCVDQYKVGTTDNVKCTSESAVECQVGATAPSSLGLFSYKCVAPGACEGENLGQANCKQGISGAVCCRMPKCGKETTTASGGTATKPPSEFKLTNPLGNTTSIPVILGRIIKTFLGIVGGIALMVFVYGGLMWMTARGDSGQVKKGQDALKAASIGLFIVIFSYTLAGYLVTALTSEQTIIAAQEGRSTNTEKPTEAGSQAATVSSQLKEAEQKTQQGQAGAVQVGQDAGIPSQPTNCGSLKGQAYLDCITAGGQALYNTPNPTPNLPGGQKDCKYAPDPDQCSTIAWKTICNQKVFDTGYGAYNKMSCASQTECTSKGGTVVKTSSFGNLCGSGSVCCKAP